MRDVPRGEDRQPAAHIVDLPPGRAPRRIPRGRLRPQRRGKIPVQINLLSNFHRLEYFQLQLLKKATTGDIEESSYQVVKLKVNILIGHLMIG